MGSCSRVLIVEDHRMLREGLKSILSTRSDLKIVGEATDGIEALRAVKRLKPDIMLLDLSMPRMNGLSVLLEAKAHHAAVKILVLTIHTAEKWVKEAFAAGADGYCSKYGSARELLVAIDSVLAGHTYLSPAIAKPVVDGFLSKHAEQEVDDSWAEVSPREKEILKMLAEGYTSKEIAKMLFISPKTVETHRSNIMNKLNLHSVADLTRLAIQKGLVQPGVLTRRK